jgi:hypothetical protein
MAYLNAKMLMLFWQYFEKSHNFPVQPTETRVAIGLKIEEAGLRSGGRGKSEIFPALQKCSGRHYAKKLCPKLRFPHQFDTVLQTS